MSDAEQLVRENLEMLKAAIDTAVAGHEAVTGEESVESTINERIRVSKDVDGGVYRVDLNDNFAELQDVEEGEPTSSSILFFNGRTLEITEAEIDVMRLQGSGEVGGFKRRVSKSRLPSFVASITAQVVTESTIATE